MAAPYHDLIEEVRVMLVSDDKNSVSETIDLLKTYDYKVIPVGKISAAMSMLSKEKKKIDVIIVNAHSLNLRSFQLLAQAVALDIILLFVCDEDNKILGKKALDEGAFLYLKKPLDKEIMKYLWQFVLRKKIQREKAGEGSEKNGDMMNIDNIDKNIIIGDEEEQNRRGKKVSNIEKQNNSTHEAENEILLNEKYKPRKKKCREDTKEINEGENQSGFINNVVRRRTCTKWTEDLHSKFMNVVQQLGEGGCYPNKILELMNVPGLTRKVVASHLQKCRTNKWKAPKERKSIRYLSGRGSSNGSQQKSRFRKFGTMPPLQTNVPNLQCNPDQTQRGPEFLFSTLNANNIFTRGESSIQQQLYYPQLEVQPHYHNIDNPLNNPFLLAQHNAGGGLQQQHIPLYGMLGSQGLPDSIIVNTNFRSGLAFNNGENHTQSDYNLYLNAAHGTTYSGSEIMSGTYIENATINYYNMDVNADNVTTHSGSTMMPDTYAGNATVNGLGASNATFQQYISEPNMSDPSNIVAALYESDIQESDSNEKENFDAYFDFSNMNYLFQNLELSSANPPNEQGNEFDKIYSNDQDTLFIIALRLDFSRNFAKTHLNISANNKDCRRHRLIMRSVQPYHNLMYCSISSLLYYDSVRGIFHLDYPMKNPPKSVFILGSVNGLICLSIQNDLILWNPSIKKYKIIRNSICDDFFLCGFGYYQFRDDYKVVDVFNTYNDVSIYSSKSDSWRIILSDRPYKGLFRETKGIFVNRNLHWAYSPSHISHVSNSYNAWIITSIDVTNGNGERWRNPFLGKEILI
ncbi:hypothetical protein HAX54_002852 [Datura stramonium]|uniref:Response regulatory domain-containing protein n=1 Tax=Datura stramonium TaxID=4076 RepID=A0ABS8T4I9_DATST|nr:hypothetical protein [Datura stramonium]